MPTIIINKLFIEKNYVSAKILLFSHLIFRSTRSYRVHRLTGSKPDPLFVEEKTSG